MVLGIIVYLYTGIGQCGKSYTSPINPLMKYCCVESVTVISDVGVQVWHRKWLVWSSTVFVPHTLIDGVIINEAILRVRANKSTSGVLFHSLTIERTISCLYIEYPAMGVV